VKFCGMLHRARGEWAGAAADFAASRRMHVAIDNEYGVMLQTYRLGQVAAELSELERAAALLEEAHELAAHAGGRRRERMTARTGLALARVLGRLGRRAEAEQLYLAALDSARRRGSRMRNDLA
jgi:tetratricopeptide (TPR) repeat protein